MGVWVYAAGGIIMGVTLTCIALGMLQRPGASGFRLRITYQDEVRVFGSYVTFSQALVVLHGAFPDYAGKWDVGQGVNTVIGVYGSYEFQIYPLDPDVYIGSAEMRNAKRFLTGSE